MNELPHPKRGALLPLVSSREAAGLVHILLRIFVSNFNDRFIIFMPQFCSP